VRVKPFSSHQKKTQTNPQAGRPSGGEGRWSPWATASLDSNLVIMLIFITEQLYENAVSGAISRRYHIIRVVLISGVAGSTGSWQIWLRRRAGGTRATGTSTSSWRPTACARRTGSTTLWTSTAAWGLPSSKPSRCSALLTQNPIYLMDNP
jgi:hypothetical protein